MAVLAAAAGLHAAAIGGCVLAAVVALYGAWRFGEAYRLTGSKMALWAAVISLAWPAVAVVTVASGTSGAIEAGAASSAGAVAIAGFGLSRMNHWRRLRLGLWLPQAISAWQRGDVAPFEQILEATLGESAMAHASRTAALAHTLAEPLSLSPGEVSDIVLAALVHPLGAGLQGRNKYSPEGPGSARRAAEMLDRIPAASGAAAVLRHFDERWDGGGPGGLSGEQVMLGGRILAAIDAFDRASEAGLEPALAEVRKGSGGAFDPVVAAELVHLFRPKPTVTAAA